MKENSNITVLKSVDNKTMVSSMFELANELANQNDPIKLNKKINTALYQSTRLIRFFKDNKGVKANWKSNKDS